MTLISYYNYYDSRIFECRGHTGYENAGKDILCSAVSCLCYTLDAYLKKAREKGCISNYSSEFSPGFVKLEFELCHPTENDPTAEAVSAILGGFLLLEESFPEYITADI